jgi:hypothetical protein
LAVLAVADEAEALEGETLVATPRMLPHRHRSGRSKGMRDSLGRQHRRRRRC